jgi:hypothetical protein
MMTALENVIVGRRIKPTRSGFWHIIIIAFSVRGGEAEIYDAGMETLQLEGVTVRDINDPCLHVGKGEIVSLISANEAGKSMLKLARLIQRYLAKTVV